MNKIEKISIIAAVIGLVCVGSVFYLITTNYIGKGDITNLTATGNKFNVPINSRVEVEHVNKIYTFRYETGHLYVGEYTLSDDALAFSDVEVSIGSPRTFKNQLTGFTCEITEITNTYLTIRLS